MKFCFVFGMFSVLAFPWVLGCNGKSSVSKTESVKMLQDKVKNCASVNCNVEEAESLIGKPADLDSRISDDEVFLLNHEFEITSEQTTAKGNLISNKFEESDVVMIWFGDKTEERDNNFGLRWKDDKVEYFEGIFW